MLRFSIPYLVTGYVLGSWLSDYVSMDVTHTVWSNIWVYGIASAFVAIPALTTFIALKPVSSGIKTEHAGASAMMR